MSVRFWTSNARALLHAFEQGVHEGSIPTWSRITGGNFAHVSAHLKDKAYMRPKIYSDSLAFAILASEGQEMNSQLYSMLQSCLIQSFLHYLPDRFSLADVSSEFRDKDGDLGRQNGFDSSFSKAPRSRAYGASLQ